MHEAIVWLQSRCSAAEFFLTGGKAQLMSEELTKLQRPLWIVNEFESACSGAVFLLKQQNDCPKRFILANVGTGTSIHLVTDSGQRRVGGTGVGGGTLIGLSGLLSGIRDYAAIVQTAQSGERSMVEIKVSDIYEDSEPPIPGDLTASNFGKATRPATYSNADLLASVLAMIGETVSSLSVMAAGQSGVTSIVYIGSTFLNNPFLQNTVGRYTKLRGCLPYFPLNGEYSGAVGACLSGKT